VRGRPAGRGESGDSTNDYAIEQEFADIAAIVDSLAQPADLFGHSYGATVALGAASLARNLRRLILYQPAVSRRSIETSWPGSTLLLPRASRSSFSASS
jgi:pimeloyl-ACP methyl ester carboxylesterase